MQVGERKESARNSYASYVERVYGTDIGRVSDIQRSIYLTEFYITEIHNKTRTSIDPEDISLSLTDGAHDLGADFIYRDDGQVFIFQSKYCSKGSHVEQKDIQHFQAVLSRLRDPKWKRNERVADAIAEIDFKKDTFFLRFISLGRIEGQAQVQTTEPLVLPTGFGELVERVNIEYFGEAELNDELRNALSTGTGIPDTITLYSAGTRANRSGILEVQSGDHRSFVMTVGAHQIVQMHQQARDSLFTLNIRNFIGNTKTNSDIRSTAKMRGELFFLYNNGISCLAKKIELSNDRCSLTTEGLQVINGAQTVKALVKAAQGGFKEEPIVLVRITEVLKTYGKSGGFTSDITRYNNTQNVIKVSDFRSNDAVQNDLKAKFDYVRFGKRVEYIPKRTDVKLANTVQIRLEEFSKVIYAFLHDPVKFAGSTSFLFDESVQGGYINIFGNGTEIWDVMPEDEFKLRSAIWWMSAEFERTLKLYKAGELEPDDRSALERKWFLLYAARLHLQRAFGESTYADQLRPVYRGDWKMDEGKPGMFFRNLYDLARDSVLYVYKSARAKPDFVHRQWVRGQGTPSSVNDLALFIKQAPQPKLEPLRS